MAEIIDLDDSIERIKDCLQEMHLGIAKNHKCQKVQWDSVSILRTFPPTNPCSKKAIRSFSIFRLTIH